MSDMVPRGSKYTDEQRMEAAVLYAAKGNMSIVARDTDIPRTTLIGWKNDSDWWDTVVAKVRHEKADEQRARYSELVDAAQEQALEKLPDASAKDAMIIAAVGTDKIRLSDGMPTSISSTENTQTQIRALAEQFAELSRHHNAKDITGKVKIKTKK